jgi:biotin operon repressor
VNNRSGNRKALTAAALTALVMGAIGGTAAIAGTQKPNKRTVAAVKAPAKSKKASKKGSRSVAPKAVAPHDEVAEHAAFAAALAAKLGVTSEQVQSALEAIRPAPGTRPDRAGFPKALGDKLGKTEAEVKAALDALRAEGVVHGPGMGHGPDGDHHGPGGHRGPRGPEFVAALSAKLGVSETDLKAALDSLRPAPGTRPDRSAFPKALADKLGKTEAEVKSALASVRPPHGPGRDHHGGPGFGRGHR